MDKGEEGCPGPTRGLSFLMSLITYVISFYLISSAFVLVLVN